MTVVAIPPAAGSDPVRHSLVSASSSASWRRCPALRASLTPLSLSGAGPARASNTPSSRSAHSAVNSPHRAADPSGRCRTVRSRLRSRSFGSSKFPSGSSQAWMCSASVCSDRGSNSAHRPPVHVPPPHRVRPAPPPAAPPPPARSPGHARPRSHRPAAPPPRRRTPAPTPHPSTRASGLPLPRPAPAPPPHRGAGAAPAATTPPSTPPHGFGQRPRRRLRDQPVPHRRQPPRQPLHLPQRVQQLGIRTHGQIHGQQVIHERMRTSDRDTRRTDRNSLAHTVDFMAGTSRSALSTTHETRFRDGETQADSGRERPSPLPSSMPPFAFQTVRPTDTPDRTRRRNSPDPASTNPCPVNQPVIQPASG